MAAAQGGAEPSYETILKANAWLGRGQQVVADLAGDIAALSTTSAKNDVNGMLSACAALGPHVSAGRALPPFPDRPTQQAWAASVSHLGAASVYCQKSKAANGNVDLLNQMADEVNKGNADLQRFADHLEKFGDRVR